MKEEKITYQSSDNISLVGLLSRVNNDSKIVILCHGLGGNKSENGAFDFLTSELEKNNINSFRFDFSSHGESSGEDYNMTISGELADLEATISLLEKQGFNDFIILGASFGASIVSLLDYSNHKNIKGLISWYGALDYQDKANKAFTKEAYEIAKKEGVYTRLKNNGTTVKYGLKLFDEVYSLKPYENLSKLNLPILFIHGTSDKTVPYELSVRVSKNCSNAILKLIEEGEHTFRNSKPALAKATSETISFIINTFK